VRAVFQSLNEQGLAKCVQGILSNLWRLVPYRERGVVALDVELEARVQVELSQEARGIAAQVEFESKT
jgi:hypothetical protein